MPIATNGEYNGNKTIVLKWDENDKYPFSFGVGKARLILACIAEIQKFVDENPKKQS